MRLADFVCRIFGCEGVIKDNLMSCEADRSVFKQEIDRLLLEIDKIQQSKDDTMENWKLCRLKKDELTEQVAALTKKLKDLAYPTEDPMEAFWNSKHPKKDIAYKRTEQDGEYLIDVRNYFQVYDFNLLKIVNDNGLNVGTFDERALKCLNWVHTNITYISDKIEYGLSEFWCYPYQTIKHKKGDCEDQSILLANLMFVSGVPYWRIRLCAGWVFDGTNTNTEQKYSISQIGDLDWFLKKRIDCGIIQELKQTGLNQANEEVNQLNLKLALFRGIKESEKADNLFVNMLGKQLDPGAKFVNSVDKMIEKDCVSTTKIKIEKTTLQKIYKYYVLLVILDIMEKKGILDNLKKDKFLGITEKGTAGNAGHAYVTYCRETDNQFVVMDCTYWYKSIPVSERKLHKDEADYYSIWFSWNQKYAFGEMETMSGMKGFKRVSG